MEIDIISLYLASIVFYSFAEVYETLDYSKLHF